MNGKKRIAANRLIKEFEQEGIQVLNGRYGPYITNKEKNARIPKDREPKSLTLEECKELLEAAPVRGRRGKKKTAAKKNPAKKKQKEKKKAKKKARKKSGKKTGEKNAGKKKPVAAKGDNAG